MSPSTLYTHPGGAALSYGASVLTATDKQGHVVRLPIGHGELLELAMELATLASGDASEQAGAEAATDCLDALRVTDGAGERIRLVRDAITGLQDTTAPDRALNGFAVVLAGILKTDAEGLQ